MTDQCHFCTLRGHIRACEGTDCDIHENWYAQTLKNALAGLDPEAVPKLVEAAKKVLPELKADAMHDESIRGIVAEFEAALSALKEAK